MSTTQIDPGVILEALPGLAWTGFPDGRAEYLSRQWLEFTGMSLEEASGPGWINSIHPDDGVRLHSAFSEIVASGRPGEAEIRMRRHDGAYRWFMVRVSPMLGPAGEIIRWCGVNIDIDDRVRAEEALREQPRTHWLRGSRRSPPDLEIDLGYYLDTLPAQAWVARSDGNIQYIGRPWLDYTGLSFEEAGGVGWIVTIHPEDIDHLLEEWAAVVASEQTGQHRARIRAADGQYRWHLFRASPMRDASGEIVRWAGVTIDIDDLVRAEAELQDHRTRLERIFEGLPVIAGMFSAQGEVLTCNERMVEFLGRTLEQVKARPSAFDHHPEDHEAAEAAWWAAVREGRPYDHVARLRRHDGAYVWHRVLVTPLRNAAGEIEVLYGVALDIDLQVRAQAALAGEKRLLQMVATGTPLSDVLEALCHEVEGLAAETVCGVLLAAANSTHSRVFAGSRMPGALRAAYDEAGNDPAWGPAMQSLVNRTTVTSAHLAEDSRWADSPLPQIATHVQLPACWSTPILGSNGQAIGVLFVHSATPVRDEPGDIDFVDRFVHIAGIAAERAQADAALKASEANLMQAHAHLSEAQRLSRTGSFTWDVERDEHNWSDEERRTWEFEPDSKITLPMILETIHPDDVPLARRVIASAPSQPSFELVLRIVPRSGVIKHLHIVGRRMEEIGDRPVFLGAIQDITERKRAEEALDRARAELAHVSRTMTLSALTASIAHEVNQPLSGIITNANTGLRMLAADPPNLDGLRTTVQRTLRDGNRAKEVILRLRAMFSRQTPGRERVDLNDAAREILALSAGELERRRVALTTDLDEGMPAVSGDRIQLQQVILNLVMNAADAMDGIDDRPRSLRLQTQSTPTDIVLSVRDSGVGLDPDGIEQLFQTFYTTKADGMGVGLAVSRTIIETHDGQLWAEPNADGPGATFVFKIPIESSAGAGPETTAGTIAGAK